MEASLYEERLLHMGTKIWHLEEENKDLWRWHQEAMERINNLHENQQAMRSYVIQMDGDLRGAISEMVQDGYHPR